MLLYCPMAKSALCWWPFHHDLTDRVQTILQNPKSSLTRCLIYSGKLIFSNHIWNMSLTVQCSCSVITPCNNAWKRCQLHIFPESLIVIKVLCTLDITIQDNSPHDICIRILIKVRFHIHCKYVKKQLRCHLCFKILQCTAYILCPLGVLPTQLVKLSLPEINMQPQQQSSCQSPVLKGSWKHTTTTTTSHGSIILMILSLLTNVWTAQYKAQKLNVVTKYIALILSIQEAEVKVLVWRLVILAEI
jgi:hypothetical protein